MPVSDQRKWNRIARRGVDPEDVDNQMAMIIGLADAASGGDSKAAKVLIDLLGEENGPAAGENTAQDDPLTKSLKEELEHGLLK